MKKIFAIFVFSLFFVGCVSDVEFEGDHLVDAGQRTGGSPLALSQEELNVLSLISNESQMVSLDEATDRAEGVMSLLSKKDGPTRSSSRRIKSLTFVDAPETRSGDPFAPEGLAYICNFEDNMGYAIISADKRIPAPVLAYSDRGNIGDETDNPGFALFLANAEDYIDRSIVEYEMKKDSIYDVIQARIEQNLPCEYYDDEDDLLKTRSSENGGGTTTITTVTTTENTIVCDWENLEGCSPLLPVEWAQSAPYNDLVKTKNGSTNAPTGCVATAAAMLMAYWKYPTSIDGYTFDWNRMNMYSGEKTSYQTWVDYIWNAPSDVKNMVARLMERIGGKIGMNYSDSGSGAHTNEVPKMLKSMGYAMADMSTIGMAPIYTLGRDYNYNTIKNALNAGRPVLADGYAYKTVTKNKFLGITVSKTTNYSGGHAWVIDGYGDMAQRVKTTITVKTTVKDGATGRVLESSTQNNYTYSYINRAAYIHNNWGWEERFNPGSTKNGYFISGSFDTNATHLPSDTRSGTAGNYQYNVDIFPYIKK